MKTIFTDYRKKNSRATMMIVVLSCLLMAVVDTYLIPGYFLKSTSKILLLAGVPVVYSLWNHDIRLTSVLESRRDGKSNFRTPLILGASVYVLILAVFILISGFVDLEQIKGTLSETLQVNSGNFFFVAAYIAIVNSLLEEFFFRGFAFLKLREWTSYGFSHVFSALAFALYHVAILKGWVSPLLTMAAILGLFGTGIFFNWLNERNGNIYNSYVVHMFANFAINTIGLHMYGIIRLPFL
ncbi:MAG TPA: CPBP family intramembrane glutamic endopeptidase [Clostridiaceae bacterium]|nr:CPBP family intramembrane glutamic endopeptidase [Clostridiaceae bacterium]